MNDAANQHPDDLACAPALAMLGMVAALICFIAERVLPRWSGQAEAGAALLRVQIAMVALAGAAWRDLEAGGTDEAAWEEMQGCATAVLSAMQALLAATRRTGGARWTAGQGVSPKARQAWGIPARRELAVRAMPAGLARDGPREASAQAVAVLTPPPDRRIGRVGACASRAGAWRCCWPCGSAGPARHP